MYFNKAFEDGAKFQLEDGETTVEVRDIGSVYLPTGTLVACDPFSPWDADPFTTTLEPGHYPVVLSIAHIPSYSGIDQRIAMAAVRISDATPVKWWTAETVKPDMSQIEQRDDGLFIVTRVFGYGVDTACGAFMDMKVAKILTEKIDQDGNYMYHAHDEHMNENYVNTRSWASIVLEPETGLNFAIFSTGTGDGFYQSYWGNDASGKAVCLATDFKILFQVDEIGS